MEKDLEGKVPTCRESKSKCQKRPKKLSVYGKETYVYGKIQPAGSPRVSPPFVSFELDLETCGFFCRKAESYLLVPPVTLQVQHM